MNTSDSSVYYGDSILFQLQSYENKINKVATNNNLEPLSYSFSSGGGSVVSDTFSFLDINPDDMKADGNAGLRQIHSYFLADQNDNITGDVSNSQQYNNKMSSSQQPTYQQQQSYPYPHQPQQQQRGMSMGLEQQGDLRNSRTQGNMSIEQLKKIREEQNVFSKPTYFG